MPRLLNLTRIRLLSNVYEHDILCNVGATGTIVKVHEPGEDDYYFDVQLDADNLPWRKWAFESDEVEELPLEDEPNIVHTPVPVDTSGPLHTGSETYETVADSEAGWAAVEADHTADAMSYIMSETRAFGVSAATVAEPTPDPTVDHEWLARNARSEARAMTFQEVYAQAPTPEPPRRATVRSGRVQPQRAIAPPVNAIDYETAYAALSRLTSRVWVDELAGSGSGEVQEG